MFSEISILFNYKGRQSLFLSLLSLRSKSREFRAKVSMEQFAIVSAPDRLSINQLKKSYSYGDEILSNLKKRFANPKQSS